MNRTTITVLSLALVMVASGTALAQHRPNPLDDQPAVRHRMLLVKGRFELTPLFESTVNADYRHILGPGLKLEYHFSDMLSVGVIGAYGFDIDTGLTKKLFDSLDPPDPMDDRAPTREALEAHLNSMPIHGAAFVSLTPWYGKLAAFSKGFVNFDFYFQAGVAFAQLKSDCPTSICNDTHPGVDIPDPDGEEGPMTGEDRDNNPIDDPPLNDGNKIGLYLGGGVHVFLTEWLALDLTVRDYAFSDNPSGADFDADLAVTKEDSRFLHHLFFGIGASIMLPPSAKRTR
jgi:outer membrane beta-barrel protein